MTWRRRIRKCTDMHLGRGLPSHTWPSRTRIRMFSHMIPETLLRTCCTKSKSCEQEFKKLNLSTCNNTRKASNQQSRSRASKTFLLMRKSYPVHLWHQSRKKQQHSNNPFYRSLKSQYSILENVQWRSQPNSKRIHSKSSRLVLIQCWASVRSASSVATRWSWDPACPLKIVTWTSPLRMSIRTRLRRAYAAFLVLDHHCVWNLTSIDF